ncbi:MAG TPA: rhomboid family intramembrane serine protease [Urbifossiella sp.]|nr:rhomboid family intramembrane serine protease [Urbifossiella sp.]
MDPATEVLPPPPEDATPPPRDVSGFALRPPPTAMPADRPTPESVLRAVVEAGGPWFPSAHARRTGVPRAALDDALTELRTAGLVRVAAWVKGVGQGYVATPEGEQVAARIGPAEGSGPELVSPALSGLLDFRTPLVTPALIGANILWFAVAAVVAVRWGMPVAVALGGSSPAILERVGAVSAHDLVRGQWWRLLTCAFVHVGFWHLALNMVMLGTTGPAAELFWGRWRALAVYFIAALAAGAAALALRPVAGPAAAPVLVAGASGAIWGLMGAVLAWYVLYRPDLPSDIATDMGRRLGFAFLLNAGICLLPQVSWEGHLAGGLAGFLAAGLLNSVRFESGRRRTLAAVLLLVIPAASACGLAAAMRWGDEWAPLRVRPAPPPAAPAPAAPDPNARLEPVRPESARSARWAAVRVWLVSPEFREKNRLVARAEIDALARRVGAVREQLAATGEAGSANMTGAEARLRELDQLRELVNAAEMPTAEAWQAWGGRRREADQFWAPADTK